MITANLDRESDIGNMSMDELASISGGYLGIVVAGTLMGSWAVASWITSGVQQDPETGEGCTDHKFPKPASS